MQIRDVRPTSQSEVLVLIATPGNAQGGRQMTGAIAAASEEGPAFPPAGAPAAVAAPASAPPKSSVVHHGDDRHRPRSSASSIVRSPYLLVTPIEKDLHFTDTRISLLMGGALFGRLFRLRHVDLALDRHRPAQIYPVGARWRWPAPSRAS